MKTAFQYRYILELSTCEYGCLVGLQFKEGKKQRQTGGTMMSNVCLISHSWCDVEKLTVPGSSDLIQVFQGHSKKFCVRKIKEECVTFCFIKFGPSSSKKNLNHLPYWNSFKIDEKCFLFHLKSSFRSQDISVFVMTFWSRRKNSLIRKTLLTSKFMMSHPD